MELPKCCGEPMQAIDRYRKKGHVYVIFCCNNRGCTQHDIEVQVT